MVGQVGFDAVVRAQSPHDHVLHFGLFRFFQRHEAAPDLLHHQGVIVGELHDIIVADEIDAAVADVGNGKKIAVDRDSHDRGTHAGMMKISCAGFVDGLVGQLNGAG